MASWRPHGSILVALGLDVGGPGPRFWRVLGTIFRKFRPFLGSFLRSGRFTDKMPRMPRKPRTPRTPSQHKSFPSMPGAKCGWAAVSPPRGSSIRRPPKVVRSVSNPGYINSSNLNAKPDQLQMPNLITLSPGCLDTPL